MRTLISLAAVAAFSAGGALAGQAPNAQQSGKDAVVAERAQPARTLFVCEDDEMTRRAFAREFGKVEFVTAEQARARGETWETPKCITEAEARRLQRKELASAR